MTCLVRSRARRDTRLSAALLSRRLVVLMGLTGSGKTALLRRLILRGAQALDLEALSAHRGSVFGGSSGRVQPTPTEFVRRITNYLRAVSPARPIWVEDKGSQLGDLAVPDCLRDRLQSAEVVVLRAPLEVRVRNLLSEYGAKNPQRLQRDLSRLRHRFPAPSMMRAQQMLGNGDLEGAVRMVLPYYDAAYAKPEAARVIETIDLAPSELDACAAHLLRLLESQARDPAPAIGREAP